MTIHRRLVLPAAPRRLVLSAALIGLLAGSAGASTVEIDALVNGLYDWTLVQDGYEAWEMDTGVLVGKAKSFKGAEVIYKKGTYQSFELFFKIDKKPKKVSVILVPDGGERVDLKIDKRWADRRSKWTQCVLRVEGGKARMEADGKDVGSWELPDVPYKIGFKLDKGGKVQLSGIQIVWHRLPPPKAEVEAGFVDLLKHANGIDGHFIVGKNREGTAVAGDWKISENVLMAKNPEMRKISARLSRAAFSEYELRFKVRSGARNLNLIAHMGAQNQPNTQLRWTLDGYLTGAEEWHTFVVSLKSSRITLNVNGVDVIAGAKAPPGRSQIAWLLGSGGRAEIRDMHIRAPEMRGGAPAGGSAGGGGHAGGGKNPPFFNGKDLAGWMARPEGTWKVVSGAIFCVHPGPGTASIMYRYGITGDYKVTFSVELGTAGLALLTRKERESGKESRIVVPPKSLNKDWNACELIVRGSNATLLVNGVEVGKAPALPGAGFFGFLVSPGGACRIKNPEIGSP